MKISLNNITDLGANIWLIALTGGPCSGKTTGLARLIDMLKNKGYKVLISPEVATLLIQGGFHPREVSTDLFQDCVLRNVLAQEESFIEAAKAYRDLGHRVVVLFDRGAMDCEAYMKSPAAFEQLVASLGLTLHDICEGRYHAVIHMQTAAIGAEPFYTRENNPARLENLEEAREADRKTLQAWQRHHHPRMIDNSTDFDGKIARVLAEVCSVLGDPEPIEREQKFLIEAVEGCQVPVHSTLSVITQDYLVSDNVDEERRVRARTQGNDTSYTYTVKRPHGNGSRFETERIISKEEYERLIALRDPRFQTIRKRRLCFFWQGQFIEIDLFNGSQGPGNGLALMEIEQSTEQQELVLPPFILVVANVTGSKEYSNREIARIAS